MTPRFCPQCGTEISDEYKFCPACGSKVPEATVHPAPPEPISTEGKNVVLVCPTCGFRNNPGTKSCESCGTFLGTARSEEVAGMPTTERAAERQAASQPPPRRDKEKKKSSKPVPSQEATGKKKFHLEVTQIAAIVAALVLGGVLVYGLMSSKSTAPEGGSGGNMPAQQTTSNGQPSPDVLHEIDRLRQVVDKNPGDLGSLLRLSNILQDNGFYDQAAVYYKRYLDKVPKNVDARVDYGVTLFEGGHTQEAIDEIKDALKIDPKHQIGLFNLGIVYLNAGEFDKANAAFKECVKVNPNSEIGKKAQQTLEQHANITSQEVN